MSPIPTMNIDQHLSLYIPVVESEVANLDYIYNVFKSLNIGEVKSVQFKPKECGYTMCAFVHFDKWYENICVSNLQERILGDEGEGRIVYDDPKYWIIKKNTNPIPDNYAKQLEDIRQQNQKNYVYLLEYIQTLHTTINEQAKIMDKLNWWNNLHECNIKYLCEQIENMKQDKMDKEETENKEELQTRHEDVESNWRDQGRLRKRRLVDYSDC